MLLHYHAIPGRPLPFFQSAQGLSFRYGLTIPLSLIAPLSGCGLFGSRISLLAQLLLTHEENSSKSRFTAYRMDTCGLVAVNFETLAKRRPWQGAGDCIPRRVEFLLRGVPGCSGRQVVSAIR
jgi:hypothetical protein